MLEVTPGFEPGIRVLQTLALPLGYVTVYTLLYANLPKKSTLFLNFLKFFCFRFRTAIPRFPRSGRPVFASLRLQTGGGPAEGKRRNFQHSAVFRPQAGNGAALEISKLERATRLELATSTLARWRSTR